MCGMRGCRLGLVYPELTIMQAKAIFKAAANVKGSKPWIEVPLAGNILEYTQSKKLIEEQAKLYAGKTDYKIGSMIEIPRACITADKFA